MSLAREVEVGYSAHPTPEARGPAPSVRIHDLRHTCSATLLPTRGVHPKIVQELLGHTNVSITLDTYSRVLSGMGDAATRAMDDALG